MIFKAKTCRITAVAPLAAAVVMMLFPARSAAADYRSVVVTGNDGSAVAFAFSPTLSFSITEKALQVRDENVEVDVPRDIFAGFYFSEEEASLDSPADCDVRKGVAVMTDAGVKFTGLPAGTTIGIYAADGKLIGTHTLSEAVTVLPYISFAQGVNFVKTPSLTFKILVK